ncbi:MAG: murein L,D-transpeptidase [Micavibrio sp.]|nr:murein L,D-transpeptidase [Micavibrio sp.]|tara:strand:- start:15438 stop:17189 length:1752 start_codon:yes stop_codon:yes gene_type:complete
MTLNFDNKKIRLFFVSVMIVALYAVFSMTANQGHAQISPLLNDAGATTIALSVQQTSLNLDLDIVTAESEQIRHKVALQRFYEARDNQPYWINDSGVHSRAEAMYKIIDEAWTHGLNPHDYHYVDIYNLLEKNDRQSLADLELLLSDAFVRYAIDLSGKRLEPSALGLEMEGWKVPLNAPDVTHILLAHDFDAALDMVQPKGQTYRALRRELIRLVNQGPGEKEYLLPIEFTGILRPGSGHKAIPKIREYLGLEALKYNNTTYDDNLAAAVIRFQKENGLEADGVIGSNTLEVINRTNMRKIEQVIVNMERLRWVDTNRGDKFVIVNIPSATLWAIEGGRVAFEMPVIVGNPVRQTNLFNAKINGVRLNPDWTVPPTIKKFDILPKLQEDPGYVDDKGMELIQGYGADAVTLDPHSIDWKNISVRDLHSIRMVQVPGDHNPLGRYRVLMPNRHNIYLHDTNHKELFSRSERALSSGCVRMQNPRQMIDFLLKDADNMWDGDAVDSTLATYKKTDIDLNRTVPVSLLYYTTWLDDNGDIVYGNDIYGRDQKLLHLLRNIDGVFIPVHNERYTGARSDAHFSYNQ